jgi:hypothetical protein
MSSQPPVQARSAIELLDAAVGLYLHNFPTMLRLVALVAAPQVLLWAVDSGLQSWYTAQRLAGRIAPGAHGANYWWIGDCAVWLAIIVLLLPLCEAAVTLAVSDLLSGRAVAVKDAYQRARRHWGALVGAQALIVALVGAVGLLAFLVLGLLAMFVGGNGGALESAAFLIAATAWYLAVAVTYLRLLALLPALVLENRGALEALRRSYELVGRHGRHALLALLPLGLVVFVPALISLQQGLEAATAQQGTLYYAVTGDLAFFAALLLLPIPLVGQVLIYYDLRGREEPPPLPPAPAPPEADITIKENPPS